MRRNRNNRFPFLELFLGLIVGSGVLVVIVLIVSYSRPRQTPVGLVTAVLNVIPAPTETPVPPTPISVTQTTDAPAGLEAGILAVGGYVQVSGTQGDGLRVREGPGLGYEPLFLGLEAEIFKIIAGPQEADGYTWWHLAAPFDENLNGWSVDNYLVPVEEP